MIQLMKRRKRKKSQDLKRGREKRKWQKVTPFLSLPLPATKELPHKNNRAHRKESIIYMYNHKPDTEEGTGTDQEGV